MIQCSYKYFIFSIVTIFLFSFNSLANEQWNKKSSKTRFSSYAEFAQHNCLPCHYGSENSTNLIQPIERMNENELQLYLSVMLTYGNMPPDPIFRQIFMGKLNAIQNNQ